jgi:hypothetical protein
MNSNINLTNPYFKPKHVSKEYKFIKETKSLINMYNAMPHNPVFDQPRKPLDYMKPCPHQVSLPDPPVLMNTLHRQEKDLQNRVKDLRR